MRKAALVLATSVAFLLSVTSTYAATRQTVNHGQTARSMINGQNATTGTVSTPAGAAAFFGDAYTSYHTAGNRFNSGDSVPNSGSGSGSGSTAKQPVNVTPGNFFNKARAATMAKNALKGGVVGVAVTAAVEYAISQIPGVEVSPENELVKPSLGTNYPWGGNQYYYHWRYYDIGATGIAGNPEAAVKDYWSKMNITNKVVVGCSYSSATNATCDVQPKSGGTTSTVPVGRSGSACQSGSWNGFYGGCYGPDQLAPIGDTDWNALEGFMSTLPNTDWYQDLIKASCEGSLNPDGCYDSLVDNPFVIGPATQTGKSSSTTTNTTNPDGTTSTTTTTSTPSYSYTYGDTYYDYDTTVTTTTNNNGQVTTTVQTDTQEGEPEEDPTEDQEDDLAPPDLNDPYQPVVTKYNSIAGDVTASAPVDASVNYSPWYSFGGSCTEIQAELPIYGNWSTNYCPLVNDWVRPILSFLLILFTWHTCYDMWREALRIGRPI
jgi:hypothetical protein